MKQLFIIRHAKSSIDFFGNDFERPLNAQGHKDAPLIAKKLLEKNISIDAFVSSDAVRAFTTATYFAEVFGKKEEDILLVNELYHANVSTFYKVISHLDVVFSSVAIFSHNPGITEFVNRLTSVRIVNMTPCSIFALSVNTASWKDFIKAEKSFLFFEYPKTSY